jgi:hypothetical protein
MRHLSLALLLVASCKSGPERFATTATYTAPRSAVRVVVYAKGAVPAHQDLATNAAAEVVVCPTSKVGHAVRLAIAPMNAKPRTVAVTDGSATTSMSWEPTYREGSLTRALAAAGFPPPDPTELAELADAIDSVALGPKGTRIAGQTRTLVVAPVDFEAHAPPTIASCTP